MNENLGQVSVMIGNLRNMAIDIGQELDHQNEVIDAVKQKVISFI
jgi:synaptosomal-associated protein 25